MHCVLNGTNFGIRSLFSGVTDSTLIWDTILFSWSYGLYVPWDTVPVRLAYAYIYCDVMKCVVYLIYCSFAKRIICMI